MKVVSNEELREKARDRLGVWAVGHAPTLIEEMEQNIRRIWAERQARQLAGLICGAMGSNQKKKGARL